MQRMIIVMLMAVGLFACDSKVRTNDQLAVQDTVHDTVMVREVSNDSTLFLDPAALPVTLPVIDAMFYSDSTFESTLRDSLQLNDQQIQQLKAMAREEATTVGSDTAAAEGGGTMAARERAMQRISGVIGAQKTYYLGRLVRDRWGGTPPDSTAQAAQPGTIPADTRIVINAPDFRMDLFDNGQLVRSFDVAVGYPQFPLPIGLRTANEIIFNPPWTPPDEPWVESSKKVKVGQRVDPGSKDNPLGIMKIPIGLPSLIHGGKSMGQIGNYGSHGCAGLTDKDAKEFALLLASASGTQLTSQQIDEFRKDKKNSHTVKLAKPVPVEIRYETVQAQRDGAMHFFADIYGRGTTTEAALSNALSAAGMTLDQVAAPERAKLEDALTKMGGSVSDSGGIPATPGDSMTMSRSGKRSDSLSASRLDPHRYDSLPRDSKGNVKLTRKVKGPKELTVKVTGLADKGYPVPQTKAATQTAEALPGKKPKA